MKRLGVLVVLFVVVLGISNSAPAQEDNARFRVEVLRTNGTNLAMVRLETTSGTCWLAVGNKWIRLPAASGLAPGEYACSLTPVGKTSWILTLWNKQTGKTFIYASAVGKWRTLVEQ